MNEALRKPEDAAARGGHQRPLWFFDDGRGRFGPPTDLAAVFELPAGGRTLRERAEARLGERAAALWTAPGLAAATAERSGVRVNPGMEDAAGGDRPVLFVNGRWDGLDAALAGRLLGLGAGEAVLDEAGAPVGVAVGSRDAAGWAAGGFEGLPAGCVPTGDPAGRVLIDRPWDLLDRLAAGLGVDAGAWAVPGAGEAGPGEGGRHGEGVRVHPGARVHPTACLDGSAGPVVVEAGAGVQAFAWVQGPAWIGAGATVAPHAQLRGPVVVGAGCKVGGEVKNTIFGAGSNKAHGGYLGDAVVGRWCNLGAGTTASNLKNTWGSVRVKLSMEADREDTGRTFQGPVIGDFVKTGIGTRLPTGCVVGTGACLAGSAIAPPFVPPMTFTTDAGVAPMEPGPFFRSIGRQMERRGEAPGPALVERLRGLMRGSG